MKKMRAEKIAGALLIIGATGVLIPYTTLTIIFEYPIILRQDPATILLRFHEGGSKLIFTWLAFALAGIPLIPAYIMIGQRLEKKSPLIRIATNIGLIGLIVQMIGLLRWVFVVPVLANTYMHAADDATGAAAIVAFKMIHQFAGVLLGEHIGQLFTIIWTVLISLSFLKLHLISRKLAWLGFISATIYLLAQADLFATVIPGFPVWNLAGLIGSMLWLVWLVLLGIRLMRMKHQPAA